MPVVVDDNYIYLDYAATSPLCEEASRAMSSYQIPGRKNIAVGGNPNSLHTPGRAAFDQMQQARQKIARIIGARSDEVIFTSGATESNNMALFGLVQGIMNKQSISSARAITVITSALEHDAVLEPARRLEAYGCHLVVLRPNRDGFIEPQTLEQACNEFASASASAPALLVSVQMANSEIGCIQPMGELVRIAHAHGALFHTDATQALGKIPVNFNDLGVDAASFSAHKFAGPQGVGALYLRARTPFVAQSLGGGQEEGKRSGTQDVCGIVGMAAALEAAENQRADEYARLTVLRDRLYESLNEMPRISPTISFAPGCDKYLPHIVHVLVSGIESETLIVRLDEKGIGVSGGSACSTNSLEPSHVLLSLGISRDDARGALRISMGRYTTSEDIEKFLNVLPQCMS